MLYPFSDLHFSFHTPVEHHNIIHYSEISKTAGYLALCLQRDHSLQLPADLPARLLPIVSIFNDCNQHFFDFQAAVFANLTKKASHPNRTSHCAASRIFWYSELGLSVPWCRIEWQGKEQTVAGCGEQLWPLTSTGHFPPHNCRSFHNLWKLSADLRDACDTVKIPVG